MIEWLAKARQLVQDNLAEAQQKQQREYNKGAHVQDFSMGDKVLALLPTMADKLLM